MTGPLPSPHPPRLEPWVIGHRGARRLAVENTLESLRIALADGADGVEFDVQRTADGELVLFHDDDLRRLAGRPEALVSLPWRVLRDLPLRDGQLQPQRIAHFDAVLELLADYPRALVNAELKVNLHDPSGGRHLADGFVRRMERHPGVGWLVSSFDAAPLVHAHAAGLTLPLAALVDAQPPCDFWPLTTRAEADVPLASVNPHVSLVNADRLALWREKSWQVWAWTVNAPRQWEALTEQGVTALITDEPDQLLHFLRRHGKR